MTPPPRSLPLRGLRALGHACSKPSSHWRRRTRRRVRRKRSSRRRGGRGRGGEVGSRSSESAKLLILLLVRQLQLLQVHSRHPQLRPSFSVSSNIKDTNIKDPHSLGGGLRRTASAGMPRSNTSYLRSNASIMGAGGEPPPPRRAASARLCLVAPAQHRCFELPRPRALVRPYATQICGLKRGLTPLRYAAVLRASASKLLVYEALSYLSY